MLKEIEEEEDRRELENLLIGLNASIRLLPPREHLKQASIFSSNPKCERFISYRDVSMGEVKHGLCLVSDLGLIFGPVYIFVFLTFRF